MHRVEKKVQKQIKNKLNNNNKNKQSSVEKATQIIDRLQTQQEKERVFAYLQKVLQQQTIINMNTTDVELKNMSVQ